MRHVTLADLGDNKFVFEVQSNGEFPGRNLEALTSDPCIFIPSGRKPVQ